jgi:hypothetical protein
VSGGELVPWREVHPDATAVWTPVDRLIGDGTRAAIRAGVNPNTERAYARQQAVFEAWCAVRGRSVLPASPETFAEYAADLVAQDYAPATIEQAVAPPSASPTGAPDTPASPTPRRSS